MPNTMKLEVVTPGAVAYSADVEMVTLPTVTGQIGVYPQHVPLITRCEPGEMIVRRNGQDEIVALGHAIVEITATSVAVVTDMAIGVHDIDEARAEEARRRAEERLRDKISDEEVATVNAALARSMAQLKIKRRHAPR